LDSRLELKWQLIMANVECLLAHIEKMEASQERIEAMIKTFGPS
jgi:hypothetical protein